MYYILFRFGATHPCRWMKTAPYIEDMDFDIGQKIEVDVPEPLEFALQPLDPNANDDGPEMPELFKKGGILVLRDDFIEALKKGGVDNLDIYKAKIYDPDSGAFYENYKAVNIIGAISAADMSKSAATVHPGGPVIDVDFDGLTIDETRTHGMLLFRLAESTNAIVVHEKLKQHLLNEGFNKLDFLDPQETAL